MKFYFGTKRVHFRSDRPRPFTHSRAENYRFLCACIERKRERKSDRFNDNSPWKNSKALNISATRRKITFSEMQRYSVNRDYYTNSFYSMYSRGNERLTCRFYFSKQLDRHLTSSPLKESLSAPLTFHGAGNKNNPPLTRHFRVSRLVQTCSRSLVTVPLSSPSVAPLVSKSDLVGRGRRVWRNARRGEMRAGARGRRQSASGWFGGRMQLKLFYSQRLICLCCLGPAANSPSLLSSVRQLCSLQAVWNAREQRLSPSRSWPIVGFSGDRSNQTNPAPFDPFAYFCLINRTNFTQLLCLCRE